MPEYEIPSPRRPRAPAAEATDAFDLGVSNRLTGEKCVHLMLILAAALFLIAIGHRFKIRGVRYSVNSVAGVLIVDCVMLIVTDPHVYGH